MKVGTDAILLGVWCTVFDNEKVLDIGTGSGVIAMIIASRSNCYVDAIEIDKDSCYEAQENFNNSDFNDRLNIINEDFNIYRKKKSKDYDLIISNPPFFSNDLLPADASRLKSRHTIMLNHDDILLGISNILKYRGRFSVVIPRSTEEKFINTAHNYGLNLVRKQYIIPKQGKIANRVNLEFIHGKTNKIELETITLRDDKNNHSEQYKRYIKNYLLNI